MQHPKSEINPQKNQISFHLNSKIYPLEAIQAAAYVFVDRCFVYLGGDPKKKIIVFLKGKEVLNEKQMASLQGEFLNEILNIMLREKISKSNKIILEYIIGGAITAALGNKPEKSSQKGETKKIEQEIAQLKKELEKEFGGGGNQRKTIKREEKLSGMPK